MSPPAATFELSAIESGACSSLSSRILSRTTASPVGIGSGSVEAAPPPRSASVDGSAPTGYGQECANDRVRSGGRSTRYLASMGVRLQSVSARAVAERGEPSMTAKSPSSMPGPSSPEPAACQIAPELSSTRPDSMRYAPEMSPLREDDFARYDTRCGCTARPRKPWRRQRYTGWLSRSYTRRATGAAFCVFRDLDQRLQLGSGGLRSSQIRDTVERAVPLPTPSVLEHALSFRPVAVFRPSPNLLWPAR